MRLETGEPVSGRDRRAATARLEAILDEFDREIARAPRWATVDRKLLERVVRELRRRLERERRR